MLEQERLDKIFSLIQNRQLVSNEELRKTLFVSHATLRRDLLKLEKDGLIVRVRGGVSLSSIKANQETPFYIRELEQSDEKEHMCRIASEYLEENQAYFLDSSSTVSKICDQMWDKRLVVITNCLNNALKLASYRHVDVYIIGGVVKKNSGSVVGEIGREYISNFNAHVAFISCRGLDLDGIYESSFAQARIKHHMANNSTKVVLLCDSSKFGSRHFINMISYKEVDVLITNAKPEQKFLDRMKEFNCEVRW